MSHQLTLKLTARYRLEGDPVREIAVEVRDCAAVTADVATAMRATGAASVDDFYDAACREHAVVAVTEAGQTREYTVQTINSCPQVPDLDGVTPVTVIFEDLIPADVQ